MKISYLNMAPMHHELDGDMKQKFADVYFNNWFIMGKELEAFEEEYAAYWREQNTQSAAATVWTLCTLSSRRWA